MKTIVEKLTDDERSKLEQAVETVQKNKSAVEETISALILIREGRLYRETHSDFGEFCRDKFGFTKSWASRLIAGQKAIEDLETVAHGHHGLTPENIEVVKQSSAKAKVQLAKIPKSKRVKAVQKLLLDSKGKPPTEKEVKKVAATISHRAAPAVKNGHSEPRKNYLEADSNKVLVAMDNWYEGYTSKLAYGGRTFQDAKAVFEQLREVVKEAMK